MGGSRQWAVGSGWDNKRGWGDNMWDMQAGMGVAVQVATVCVYMGHDIQCTRCTVVHDEVQGATSMGSGSSGYCTPNQTPGSVWV